MHPPAKILCLIFLVWECSCRHFEGSRAFPSLRRPSVPMTARCCCGEAGNSSAGKVPSLVGVFPPNGWCSDLGRSMPPQAGSVLWAGLAFFFFCHAPPCYKRGSRVSPAGHPSPALDLSAPVSAPQPLAALGPSLPSSRQQPPRSIPGLSGSQ